jgi:hypothetical protein
VHKEKPENLKHGSQISDNAVFYQNNSKTQIISPQKWLQIVTPDPTLDIATRLLMRRLSANC